MENSSSVVLVSAFGRGHWLATSLAKEGIPVVLIDVTERMGIWPVEDAEGPFGFFRNEKIQESQLEMLSAGDSFEEVSNGFTLWLDQGPLELKGPVTKHRLSQSTLSPRIGSLLQSGDVEKNAATVYKYLKLYTFPQSWMVHFAHQFASTTFHGNAVAGTFGHPLPLHSSFQIRRISRQSHEKSLKWVESKGVRVVRPQDVVDISLEGRSLVKGLELSRETGSLLKFEKLVWLLTSEETYFLNKNIGQSFFRAGYIEPEWCWIRYRMTFAKCDERERLPLHSVLIDDLSQTWSHQNLLVLQRTFSPEQFDVWMRIPNVQRFNKEYLRSKGVQAIETLHKKMSEIKPEITSYPQEYYYTYAQLGPARFPVYSHEDDKNRAQAKFSNLYVGGPETWVNYSWNDYFAGQTEIAARLLVWWKDKLLREEKERRRREQKGVHG